MTKSISENSQPYCLQDFLVAKNQISVNVPVDMPFRLHPEYVADSVYLATSGGHDWLVHPKVAQACDIPKLYLAKLYLGTSMTGIPFVYPVLRLLEPDAVDGQIYFAHYWGELVADAATEARKQWTCIKSVSEEHHEIETNNSKWLREPKWPEGDIDQLVLEAFRNKTITTVKRAKEKLGTRL